ncbi:MAG: prepilin-type N-terminal cleavage/methylation domain-containing protein [Candidatus Moraniibacteriota bacterium]|nr:MAG: prepilin-type N-terminal cleavage/methylation domain-containing protein [Candidatus Moranbacteria bacterium]
MQYLSQRRWHRRGFTLIEALVFLFLFALITTVFFQTFAYGTALIQQSKNRLGAIALANQKMEIVRSLDYDNIGTISGIPAGDIAQDETVQVNNMHYEVHTFIQYVDDAYDGTLGGSPNDLVPNDSKRVRIEVVWGDESEAEKVALFSTFAPPGIEQSVGGGILSINILDSEGNGLSGATVHITNSSVSPSIDVTTTTDATGNLFLIGAPASSQGYHVTFSKGGHFGSATYAPYPTTAFIPVDVHASVVNAVVNQASFVMDQSSTLELRTKDPFDADIPDIDYRIDGGRQIGTQSGTGVAVLDFGMDDSTDTDGEHDYANRSYGSYTWTLDPGETGYTFIRLEPESTSAPNLIPLAPGTTQGVAMILADEAVNGVLFTVTNSTDATEVSGASVQLTNTTLTYDETVTTSQYGKAYFPETATPGMVAATYDYEITAAGYDTETGTVTVTAGLEPITVDLTPS